VEWFRLRCEDAWEGRQPALRALAGAIDRTVYAHPIKGNATRHRDIRSARVA
jgi:hypothetical protein